MSEASPHQALATDAAASDSAPADPPPPTPVEPPMAEEPITPDPVADPDVIAWEPRTWYAVTAACVTPGCRQENIVVNFPMFYSNNGELAFIRVVCSSDGCCGKDCRILTATKLDPQPVEE